MTKAKKPKTPKKAKSREELVESRRNPGHADILSCNPQADTVKLRTRDTTTGKQRTKTVAIKVRQAVAIGGVKEKKSPSKKRKKKS